MMHVRRIRAQQSHQQHEDSHDEEAALNALRSRKHKPESSSSSAAVAPDTSTPPGPGTIYTVQEAFGANHRIGPRTVGSPENEITTVNYLLDQIEQIRTESKTGPNFITVDVQRPTGCFSIEGFTSCYDQVTNVAVKFEPQTGSQHFMLANCHFDSVADSPGASDDAISCSVMLEVLHSLANLSKPLKHGVIFLFNGAEETILQASHGFITQHSWAKQVRAFVNLEATGVGGKELVFQTGPENPWLVQAYIRAAVHPFASVVGQEIFQSGLIPSDTDFRIFRDFGNIPGIDLAFIENGFLYHTKYDTPDRIHNDSIQRAGDNILSLLKHLMMSDELADSSEYRHGNMVFFDILGLMMVAYTIQFGTVINYMAVIATVMYLRKKCLLTNRMGGRYMCDLWCALCVLILSWFFSLLAVLVVALLVTLMGRSMFWYTHFYAGVCLYGSAAVGIILKIHTWAKNHYRSASRVDLAEIFFDASLLLWCFVLFLLTYSGWCSAYVPMMMVVFPLISKLLLTKLFRARGASLQYSVLYLMGLAVPYIHFVFLIWVVFEVFTPIQGRSANGIPPDFIMASIVTLATIILSSFFIHLIYLSRSTKWILAVLWSVFTLMFVLVSFGVFFPYSGNPSSPRPKRVFVQHITRRFHMLNGSLQSSDSGLCISSQDYTGMQHITPHITQINNSIRTHCQDHHPYYSSLSESWYLPAPEVSPKAPLEIQLLSRLETKWKTIQMSFEVKGPSQMSLYLLPHAGVSLSNWSFGEGTLQLNLSREYFIFYSHGLNARAWTFWIEIQSSDVSPDKGLISLAISAHYLSGSDGHSEPLESLLKRFPAWAFTSSWITTYHLYRY
ncbi:hypothetical protein QQF64_025823 [Cirrhinus molitorella]|uniref:Endoplasmic reticulum metallopeptidase 1 n=1 Tax=Cirrhinus molitorella TaxID=172907 RepID=A0ABR3NQ23_9TELE